MEWNPYWWVRTTPPQWLDFTSLGESIINHHCLLMKGTQRVSRDPNATHDGPSHRRYNTRQGKSSAIMIQQKSGNDASRTTLTVKRIPVNEYAAHTRDVVPMSEHMVLLSSALTIIKHRLPILSCCGVTVGRVCCDGCRWVDSLFLSARRREHEWCWDSPLLSATRQ